MTALSTPLALVGVLGGTINLTIALLWTIIFTFSQTRHKETEAPHDQESHLGPKPELPKLRHPRAPAVALARAGASLAEMFASQQGWQGRGAFFTIGEFHFQTQ